MTVYGTTVVSTLLSGIVQTYTSYTRVVQ